MGRSVQNFFDVRMRENPKALMWPLAQSKPCPSVLGFYWGEHGSFYLVCQVAGSTEQHYRVIPVLIAGHCLAAYDERDCSGIDTQFCISYDCFLSVACVQLHHATMSTSNHFYEKFDVQG